MRKQTLYAIKLRAHARSMRHNPTGSEYALFQLIRRKQVCGVQFRRQQIVLHRYIVDFLAPQLKLVVEVDGGYHALVASADARRDKLLARAGYTVLRIPNHVVLHQTKTAVALLSAAVQKLLA